MNHDQRVDALRAQLPESDRASFDQCVEAGCPLDLLAEEVERYLSIRALWVEVPQEAKDGLDRMNAAAEELEGLPDEEKARLYRKHLMVKRAGDFNPARHRRFQAEAYTLRARARVPMAGSTDLTRTRSREQRPRARTADLRAAGLKAGQDPGDDSDQPSPARACLRCGRDISHRRSDAKTCGTTCRKQVERHGPLAVAEPLRAVLCRCNGHHIVDEIGDGCAKCGHFLPTLEAAA